MLNGESGLYALALACSLSGAQFILGLLGMRRRGAQYAQMVPRLALAHFFALIVAFACLIASAVNDDFSLKTVALNSAISEPLFYKVTGVWGNHEGSILLWIFILAACGGSVSIFTKTLTSSFRLKVLTILGGISVGFDLFCITASNPFFRQWPPPPDGQGLNPLLQDQGLAIHPPILYAGYVGFAVPFAFAIAALLEKRVATLWGRWVRPWAVGAWAFLTCGIALGSWWSYYILGWGGYWFWDPVENAALIPWLSATALIHAIIVLEKRNALQVWAIMLAILTFAFSLSGTFLVRSGILNSVHAFANDPARGIFILTLLALIIVPSLALFTWRGPMIQRGGVFSPLSREGALVINNLLMCTLCIVLATGTLYPPFAQLLFGQSLSVGKPFFDAVMIPFFIVVMVVLAGGIFLPWKRGKAHILFKRLAPACAMSVIFALSFYRAIGSWLAYASGVAAIWLISACLCEAALRLFYRQSLKGVWARARGLPPSFYGTSLAHLGVGVCVLGMVGMSQAQHNIYQLHAGESVAFAGRSWTLTHVDRQDDATSQAATAFILVQRHGKTITTLTPSRLYLPREQQYVTHVAIHTNFLVDLYAVLSHPSRDSEKSAWIIRLNFNPLAPWIWLGGLMMALGACVTLCDRRLRVAAFHRRRAMPQNVPTHG